MNEECGLQKESMRAMYKDVLKEWMMGESAGPLDSRQRCGPAPKLCITALFASP